jgi:hypothetical protein
VSGGPLWPKATIKGYLDGKTGYSGIKMPQYIQILLVHMPSHGWWYQSLVHECGHYLLGCYDEYKDADDRDYLFLLGPDTLMENPALWVEISTNTTYDWWIIPLGYKTTKQMGEHKRNCWDTFHYYYKNIIWFDLDRDGVRDSTYPYSYVAIGGPGMSIEGGYTKITIINP